jgi:two-component system, sensor histidine kinase and response regulator
MDAVWQQTRKKQMDIEIRQKNTQLTEANAQKDKFFSIIAHDLKSPFGGLVGLTEYMAINFTLLSDNDKIESINLIDKSAKSIYNLMDNLLEWSRSMLGNVHFNPKNYEIKQLLNETFQNIKQVASLKSIDIKFKGELSKEVFADSNMFKTIIRNLLTNSIKFTSPNGLITIEAQKKENQTILIIADNGVGMDSQKIAELFKIDKTLSTLGTNGEKGTGLGLLICKEFINLHNGDLNVISTPGKGSQFTLSFPDKKL